MEGWQLSNYIQTLTLSLSDKPYQSNEHVEIVHIKEALKRLKEELNDWPMSIELANKKIDKIFGEELSE